jgi:two-component system phosphate regulon sensor histidine kinase PhoR
MAVEKLIRGKNIIDNINDALNKHEFISFDWQKPNGEIFEVRLFPLTSEEISLIIVILNVTDIRKISLEKHEFFANAGHELYTPLSSIIGYSEMMLDDKKYNKAFAETINKEATRMKLLIEDMLKISELAENKEIIDERFDLKPVIEQTVKAALPKAESKKIKIKSNLASCFIYANPEKITEVASNLIDNAIKYTNDGGDIEVDLNIKSNKAVLSVMDSGIGIPAQALSRIFERFYRVNKGRSKAEGGTGLGLAIVKHICSHYNAPIKVNSKEGIGTEITVAFNLEN